MVLVLGCALLASSLAEAEQEFKVYTEEWGLGGVVKAGLWSPLYVELESEEEDFTGVLEVAADAGQRLLPLFVKPVHLVADTPARHWVYLRAPTSTFRSPRFRCEWRLRDAKGRVRARSRWDPSMVLPAGDSVVVVLRTPGAMRTGLGALYESTSEVRTNVLFHTAARAPDRAVGYESADFLVWVNPNPSELTEVAQRDAVVEYVAGGGHLVVAAGGGWQALTGSFLADLLPAVPTGTEVVRELPAFSAYELPPDADTEMVLMRLEDVRGDVLMAHDGRPVIVRGSVGAGQVTLIGFDPTTSPFAVLRRRSDFWRKVLGIEPPSEDPRQAGMHQAASPALIRPLNDFPGFTPVNIVLVALFLVGYVVVIGPVDYFLLKRFKKLHWTWVTFPSVAIVSSVLAFWLLSAERVTGLLANAVSLVDASAGGQEVSGTTFLVFLSPKQARYSVQLQGASSGAVAPKEFEALPAAAPISMGQTTCLVTGAGERIQGLLVRILDAQTLEANWRAPAPELPEVELLWDEDGLSGTLANTTEDQLLDVTVVYGKRVVRMGTVGPGDTAQVEGGRGQSLESYLRWVAGKVPRGGWRGYGRREAAVPRTQADPVARWLSLFSCAGEAEGRFQRWVAVGGGEEGIVFDLAGRVQLSRLLSPSEAVVLYSVERSFVRVLLSGRLPESWDRTVVRLRVPVQGAAARGGGS